MPTIVPDADAAGRKLRQREAWLRLARTETDASRFAAAWLEGLIGAAGALGGAVRRPTADGALATVAHCGRSLDEADATDAYRRMLLSVYASGTPRIVSPQAAKAFTSAESAPDVLLVVAPLVAGGEIRGTIELALPSDVGPLGQREALELAGLACTAWDEFERTAGDRKAAARRTMVDEVEGFCRAVHEKLSVRHTAYVVVNDGRRLIGCDRVTLVLRRGRKHAVEAVSGLDVVERRSEAAKLLARLAAAVVETGEPLWYEGRSDDLSPQLREAVNAYVDATHVRSVGVVPLPVEERLEETEGRRGPAIGALVIERITQTSAEPGVQERARLVALHATAALRKAREHEAIPLLPLWRAAASVGRRFGPGTRLRTVAVLTALVAAAAALKFIPAEFGLHCRGVLQPVERRHVFAPLDGTVRAVHVKHGDRVRAGQLLVELRNTDLDVALADAVGRRTAAQEELLSVERSLFEDSSKSAVEERHRLAGRRSELKQRLASLDEQLRLLRRKRDLLRIVSPLDGEITTWNVEQLLGDRPVRQGQVLLDVADVAGVWELELKVPEDGIGHLLRAQEEQGPRLRVEYRLAAEPTTDRRAAVGEVHYAAEIRDDDGNTVLVRADLADRDLPALRPGAEASAKVYCGRRALGYVWLHDAVDFVRSKVWFRMY